MWGRRLVCETAFVNLEMKTIFFHEVSLLLILSTYIYFLCAGSQMKYSLLMYLLCNVHISILVI